MNGYFLILQVTMAFGYLCHEGLCSIWNRMQRRPTSKQITFQSQALLLTVLLSSLFIPSGILRRETLPVAVTKPLADSVGSVDRVLMKKTRPVPIETPKSSLKSVSFIESFSYAEILSALLCLGIFISSARLLKNLWVLRSYLKSAHLIRRHKSFRLALSETVSVPFSVWFFGARWVILPQTVLADPVKMKVSLKHELQHHRANDTLWAFWLELISPLFFLNPFFTLWKKSLSELQEFSCDESLVGRKRLNARKYGDCLVEVAEAALRSRLPLVGVAGMAQMHYQSKTSLERRIRMLLHYKKNRPKSVFVSFVGGTLVLFLTAFTVSIKSLALISDNAQTPGVASMDPRAQEIAERYLFKAYQDFKATSGFAIVSEAGTGKVLAVANIDSDVAKPHSPHWALSLRIEPASVIKALVTAAAIEEGKTDTGELHDCEKGKLLIGDKEYGDWKPFDKLTTAYSVAHSSNICGIKIGQKLGAQKLHQALKNFGIGTGELTSVFPEARSGLLASVEEKGEHYVAQTATGYGYYITPLEMVQAFGTIANGGTLYSPIQANMDEGKSKHPLRRVLSEKNAKKMREILGLVMTEGTARLSNGKKYMLAGKTGTAHSPWLVGQELAAKDSQVAHFIGFGPLESPKYVVYVGIQDPKNDADHKAHGASHAAPVFRDIIEALLN